MNPARLKANSDMLENLGFLRLRMKRSLDMIQKTKVCHKYHQPISAMLTDMAKMEKELKAVMEQEFKQEK